ncbi:amino acid ABC transporter substrate-binding protein [Acetobacterium woodii]|uniref:Putative glutamine-binding periplasmic protein n=1 Tax=Acetobacterium woodii (strain ATCC 29683 / DSM 1030 / JCM 2381 / KCTC 1655 / WB1) TaxID=931626 RepID=H6LBV5_ACEWD|nr:amino acid ABC transporter substrate-binding protein [Acetobacterium woodii]AFA47698.1 putative glutamine-binding periplasmic protein [Acetobacterium woodii DSM 1030]
MKKRSIFGLMLVVILAIGLFAGCSNTSKTDENANNDDKTFVVGLDDSFPPMGFRDEKNEIVGFDVDLAKEVGKRMGMEVKLQPINWDTKELELDSGNIDVIWNGLTITDERKKAMDFSKPYLQNDQVIVVKKDSTIKTKADLAGKNIGVQKGSSAYDAFTADAISKEVAALNEYPENVSALTDLGIGRVDAVIVDSVVARYYITSENAEFTILDESLSPELYGVGIKKGNTELQTKIQDAMDAMIADGTAATISTKWFGEDIIYKP